MPYLKMKLKIMFMILLNVPTLVFNYYNNAPYFRTTRWLWEIEENAPESKSLFICLTL